MLTVIRMFGVFFWWTIRGIEMHSSTQMYFRDMDQSLGCIKWKETVGKWGVEGQNIRTVSASWLLPWLSLSEQQQQSEGLWLRAGRAAAAHFIIFSMDTSKLGHSYRCRMNRYWLAIRSSTNFLLSAFNSSYLSRAAIKRLHFNSSHNGWDKGLKHVSPNETSKYIYCVKLNDPCWKIKPLSSRTKGSSTFFVFIKRISRG